MGESWYEMFNTPRMLFFLAGLGIATMWWRHRCRKEGHELDLTPIGIIAGVSIIVFLAIQQVGLTTEMKQCNAEFTTILRERADISDRSDRLEDELIDANSHWLGQLTNPPADITSLHTTDPAYRAWVQGTLRDYAFQVEKVRKERNDALEERTKKQYPTPTCGSH